MNSDMAPSGLIDTPCHNSESEELEVELFNLFLHDQRLQYVITFGLNEERNGYES